MKYPNAVHDVNGKIGWATATNIVHCIISIQELIRLCFMKLKRRILNKGVGENDNSYLRKNDFFDFGLWKMGKNGHFDEKKTLLYVHRGNGSL